MATENERAKILIVDDEEINIDVLVDLLKPHYKIIIATDGEQTFKRLEKRPLPDLVLLDVMMPGMDGHEVCRRLKSSPNTKGIPVIFLTVKGSADDIVTGFRLGAVDYIIKPFQPEELSARVHTHIQLKRTITKLEKALDEIKTLRGILPICANCKKIRDDEGYWHQIDEYIREHSEAEFSHGICQDCAKKLYPRFYKEI